jgi:hypothetical protein
MKNVNQPAFGFVDNRSSSYEDNEVHYGLTKREYFAAMAMQGFLLHTTGTGLRSTKDYARKSIELADELLNQLGE